MHQHYGAYFINSNSNVMNNNYVNLLSLVVLFASSREVIPNQKINWQLTFLPFYKVKYYLLGLLILAVLMSCKKVRVKPTPAPLNSIEIAGRIYKTIKIGNQEWMISNYEGPGGVRFNTSNSKPGYGKYYSWTEVQSFNLPQGWRIPATADFIELAKAQGIQLVENRAHRQEKIKSLVSKTNWRSVSGNNLSGFNAYPAGYVLRDASPIDGDLSEFWTIEGKTFSIQEIPLEDALRLGSYENSHLPEYRFNVRFVRNL